MDTTDEQLREAVARVATDGRAPCRALLEIARRLEVDAKAVGRMCNELEIKIYGCQLGCFG